MPNKDESKSKETADAQTGLKEFSATSNIIKNGDVFQADKVKPDKMPEREENLNGIHSAIEPTARGENPRNLFLYGKPGQGKTAGVLLKGDQFLEFAKQQGLDVRLIYVECSSADKSYHVLTAALKKLKGLDKKPRGNTLDDLYNQLFQYMNENGGTYIYILDEIDRIQDEDEDDLNILYKLPRAHSSEDLDDDVGCSVIGISNDRRFKSDLSPRIKDALYESELDFPPYTVNQLEAILYRRAAKGLFDTEITYSETGDPTGLESSVVSEDVVRKCAESAERERGSARQAIDLLGQAATLAHDERASQVTLDHVEKAQREVNKNYIRNMLGDHTSDDLLTLCGLLYLEARGQTPARTNQVYEYYSMYAEHVGEEPLVQRRMTDRLQDLKLTGVASLRKAVGGSPGGTRFEAELSIPMDETIEILRKDDSYAPKYGSIADEIASEAR